MTVKTGKIKTALIALICLIYANSKKYFTSYGARFR